MVGRRRKESKVQIGGEQAAPSPEAQPVPAEGSPAPVGPWDVRDLPAGDSLDRLDFGALRLWVPEGVDLRIDMGPQGELVALTLAHASAGGDAEAMQVSVFAAPRSAGIWDEVRAEIAEGIATAGGWAEEAAGGWGTELRARLVTEQVGVLAPARFVGIDGPRWFLRALFTGPSAALGQDPPLLAQALRAVVVVRGSDAMAPRDAIALHPPEDLQQQISQAVQEAQGHPTPS